MPPQEEVQALLKKYKAKLKEQLEVSPENLTTKTWSREYKQFKKEYIPKRLGFYEKACNFSEKLLKVAPNKKKAAEMQELIDVSHLEITPTGVSSFAILGPLIIMLFGSLISFAIFNSMFFILIFLIAGVVGLSAFGKIPNYIANSWRMKTSNQMVLCTFYVVTFMRHTSNLEAALKFATEHLDPPLSLDIKKILWDVETEKYESVKESLDAYLETWRKWNNEFVEAFHLIESSLFEASEDRRLEMLDKALDVILSETYEKMLHYAHNLKSPITMLHMLGVILPILGLVILPLVVNFLGEVKWYHIAALYNLILPVGVYFLGKSILSKRPTGYGDTDVSESNPALKKYKNIIINFAGKEISIKPLTICIALGIILLIIGVSPILLNKINCNFDYIINEGFHRVTSDTPECDGLDVLEAKFTLLGYRISSATEGPTVGNVIGPYGLGASLLATCVILAISLSVGLYYNLKTKKIMKIREKSKQLEIEFASALFQLGNRLGDGLPAEMAFEKVAATMQDSVSGNFFSIVNSNIRRLGMSVKDAIFNPKSGAIVFFPSKLIESSMKVLIESVKKGPKIAAKALTNISRYVKEIHKVNERLKDLMADVISSMKSQIKFLTPAISGIVIGITSMVTLILGKLSSQLSTMASAGTADSAQMNMAAMFGDGIPTYFFQIVIGFYVVQIVYILTILANGIENGSDKLNERYELGRNLTKSVLFYALISAAVMIIFNFVAIQVMSRTLSGGF
ncbi:hypothetical protein KY331_02365 [Candidatus Woesearchaeota archaeon]|nr:hypothetical protein [Candidatus Woesearchaeota archaeon]